MEHTTPPRPAATRLLLVDDNPDAVDILSQLLEPAGFEVTTATSGAEALELVRQSPPDLVLSDVVMPGMTGRDLCRAIKGDASLPPILVALISGLETRPENIADGLDCGADEYLTRPIATTELVARLRSLERLHRTQSALAETARQREEASQLLEERVADRTAELTRKNGELQVEVLQRRRAEAQLRETQGELTQLLSSISDYIWSVEVDRRGRDVRRFYSPVVESITGRPPEFYLPAWRRWLDTVHPDDRKRVAEVARALRSGRARRREEEYRIVRPDGSIRWIRNSIVARRLPGGNLHLDGIASDITARKQAEATLRELPARTLAAQEAERRRIAGELHDSVSQILSSAKFRLHAGEGALPAPVARRNRQLQRGRTLVELALREIRRITRNLRPSELDDLGLVPALRTLLDEFKDRTGLRVTFVAARMKESLHGNIALAAYRIVQEGLANIERHARASHVRIRLTGSARHVKLSLADDGRGFNLRRPRPRGEAGAGLGLVHMSERAAALGGLVTVVSARGKGTRITAELPSDLEGRAGSDNSLPAAILRA